ncbi:MAG: transglycosylase SLT domain-containing protein [Thermodesulfovibrio sp.]
MKKFLISFFLLFLLLPLEAFTEDETLQKNDIPVIKQDEKKEIIFSFDVELIPESSESLIRRIEKNILLFSEKLKNKFSVWLSRSTKYIEKMKEILIEKGLPEDLVYLPLIESGFNVNARSPKNAIGPWQFIESTARRYGLIVDWWRDERKDPIKSTYAAAKYLKDLYGMFGDWSLALAAYNAGEGRIFKAVNKAGENDYWILLNTKFLPKETKEYVPKYIAALTIAKKPEDFGFENIENHNPLSYEEVTIPSPVDLDIIAECLQVDLNTVKELNPELKRWSTPMNVKEYTIRIPMGKKEEFLENLNKIPPEKRFSYDVYITKKGDTVSKIAKKYKLSITVLYEMNGREIFKNLKPGTEIMLPPHNKFIPLKEDFYIEKKSKRINKKRVSQRTQIKKSKKV